ncbi:alpha/beta fold hydrolase [Tenacibaculum sp. TC6]|uniref:alpha/beta fold hydrolase n=1 Tax=Tenacibaculum sp. TC6 TaxID=3423223 RepID=UPI003D367F3E
MAMKNINQYFILKDKRKLGFAEYGEIDGFPIIYYHGSQSSRLEMHYDLSFVSDNNLRIISIDRPGHGISDFNQSGTILSFAEDVKELIEHLGINIFSVAGMSAGAPFVLGLTYLFPENIYKVSIISGFAPFNKKSKQYLSKKVKIILSLAKSFPFLLKIILRLQAKQIVSNPKKTLRNFLKIMSEPDQEVLKNDLVMKVIESMFKEAFKNGSKGVAYEISNLLVNSWGFELSNIKVPVTFWHGEKDYNVPFEWAELMTSEINQAHLNKYSEEGHLIIFKHAREIFTNLR